MPQRTKKKHAWFEVDEVGLAQVTETRSADWLLAELVQNAWDCPGVTSVEISIDCNRKGDEATLVVTDDGEGFDDLSHAWTLYQQTSKRTDNSKRGRFNLGEKLAFCKATKASVSTTTGSVFFTKAGRRVTEARRERGTQVTMVIPWTRADVDSVLKASMRYIPPADITTCVNGRVIPSFPAIKTGRGYLNTIEADATGTLQKTYRMTTLALHAPADVPYLLERGVPICALPDDQWSVDVDARIPVGMDRTGVSPEWLRDLRSAVLNIAAEMLTPAQAGEGWVSDALSDWSTTKEAVAKIVTARFGSNAVAADPSDPEATKMAAAKGHTVVHGGSLPARAWQLAKEAGLLQAAGKMYPTPKMGVSPDGSPPIGREALTVQQEKTAEYITAMSEALLGKPCEVQFYKLGVGANVAAWWTRGACIIGLNLSSLGLAFGESSQMEEIDELLLHEFAHEKVSDHMSHDYHDELCRLGAKLRALTREYKTPTLTR